MLKEVIQKKSKEQTLLVLDNIETHLNDEMVVEITTPAVITSLHELLIEHLNVVPHAMKLRKRVPLRRQRALLFVRAMKNGVSKSELKDD